MSRGGRPSLFAPETIDKIIALITEGHYLSEVAPAVGLSRSTVRSWLTRGKRTGEADKPYRQFLARYHAACGERILSLERTVRAAAREDGELALKMLAVLKRSRYGRDANEIKRLHKRLDEITAMIAGKGTANDG